MRSGLIALKESLHRMLFCTACLLVCVQAGSENGPCTSDYLLVKFRAERCQEALRLPPEKGLRWLVAQLPLPPGTALREPQINHWLRCNRGQQKGLSTNQRLMLDRFLYMDLPAGLSLAECIIRLRQSPLVEYVEQDGVGSLCLIPKDAGFGKQWQHYIPGYAATRARSGPLNTPETWDITTGSSNVIVAIIDSGIDSKLWDGWCQDTMLLATASIRRIIGATALKWLLS